jgi:aminoglycoside phosphotransferase (APT) family kinase protein
MSTTLDIEDSSELLDYLRSEQRIGPVEEPVMEVLPGGVSCRTVRVDRSTGESWVLKQALPKLRVEVEWLSDPARIHREALGMEWLERLTPSGSIASLVFEDEDNDLVAMKAVPQPHDQWKSLLLAGEIVADHVRQFGSLLASIHHGASERPELAEVFENRTFYESLRLEPYYEYSAGQEPAAADFLHGLVADTRRSRVTLVHGDYSPKNVLVHQGRLVLLDHEVIHWGDGAFDVGFGMTHFLAKALHVEGRRDGFLDAARLFWRTYRTEAGGVFATADYEARAVRHVIGCVLARAVGRSKLEYLSPGERRVQADAAIGLAVEPPPTVEEAVDRFGGSIGSERSP